MPTLTEQEKRRGEAILWTLALIAAMSEVTEADLALATATWQRLAPRASSDLITAETPASQYRWNPDRLRYVRPDDRLIATGTIKQQVNTFVRDAGDELADFTRTMTRGNIAIEEWQTGMATRVKSIHVAADVVAQGGLKQVGPSDVSRMSGVIDFQMRRLLKFSEDLTDLNSFNVRMPAVSDDAAISRARLYAETARSTYEESVVASWNEVAATGIAVEMQNTLADDADHCRTNGATPGCVEETARGWVPLGTMTLPGRRSCRSGCKCRLNIRRKPLNLN